VSKVIRVTDPVFQRLQALAEPLVDTPSDVIERLLSFYDQLNTTDRAPPTADRPARQALNAAETSISRGVTDMNIDVSQRVPRQRGVTIELNGRRFEAESLTDLYGQVLKYVYDQGYIDQIKHRLPITTSSKRYIIARSPVHPNGKKFVIPIGYNGYFMEAHKDYKNGLNHLSTVLKLCGLSLKYIE